MLLTAVAYNLKKLLRHHSQQQVVAVVARHSTCWRQVYALGNEIRTSKCPPRLSRSGYLEIELLKTSSARTVVEIFKSGV
jgi:hypothetical protein